MPQPILAVLAAVCGTSTYPNTTESWEAIWAASVRHRLIGVLAQAVIRHPGHVPSDLRARAADIRRRAGIRWLRQQSAYEQFRTALQHEGIACVALKGLHLAALVYDDPAQRVMADIDVLVAAEHLRQAAACAATLGYVPVRAGRSTVRTPQDHAHHLPALERNGIVLEIHNRLVPPSIPGRRTLDLEADVLGQVEALPAPLRGLGLCRADLFVHLCCHTTHHHLFDQGLRGLWDLALVIERLGNEQDWPGVVERAALWRSRPGVALASRLVADLLGAQLPPALDRLAIEVPADVVTAARHCLDTTADPHLIGQPVGRLWDPGLSMGRKLSYAWSRAFRSGPLQPVRLARGYLAAWRTMSNRDVQALLALTRARGRLSGWLNPFDD